jgi:multisubunit Na+/H+ antiporter MnhF subunit
MLNIIIPLVTAILVSITMYLISKDTKKNKPEKIVIRNVCPGIIVGLLVFVIIKYRNSSLFNQQPLMTGNFFD